MAKPMLIGLRGIYFGVPANLPEKYRITTLTCEQCSEALTASYKIIVPEDKIILT